MFAAVRVVRLADNKLNRLPFGNERADGGEAGLVVFGVQRFQRVRNADGQVCNGDTDTFFAEVKGKHSSRAGRWSHG